MAGRLLGLDVGHRRIGVALSDPSGLLATPLAVLEVRSAAAALEQVVRWMQQYGVVHVIVGLPLLLDGGEGEEAARARTWAERLREQVSVPVDLWDERLTTVSAERALLESGMSREKRQKRRDAVAAALLLQNYLDAQREARPPGAWDDGEENRERRRT